MDVTIQKIQEQENPLLDNFLYEPIFVSESIESSPKPLSPLPNYSFMLSVLGNQKMIGK